MDRNSPLPDDWRLPGVHDGRDVLTLLAEWAGQTWPATYTVKTPTGGLHLYYTAPDGPEIRNSAGRIGPAVDVRGYGGDRAAPASRRHHHPHPRNPRSRQLCTRGPPPPKG